MITVYRTIPVSTVCFFMEMTLLVHIATMNCFVQSCHRTGLKKCCRQWLTKKGAF